MKATLPYLQDEIFGMNADVLIKGVIESMKGMRVEKGGDVLYEFAKDYVEKCVRLAHIARAYKPDISAFVEVGCGLGIPSLTLSKFGFKGEAFDFEEGWVHMGQDLARKLGLGVEYAVRDFYDWQPEIPEGTLIIADKPSNLEGTRKLEQDIVTFAIQKKHNLALVPYIEKGQTDHSLKLQCEVYMVQLQDAGYRFDSIGLSEFDDCRLVIGVRK